MGRFNRYERRPLNEDRPWTIHPIWRGIGCIMVLLIPLLSYAGAVLLLQNNILQRWLPLTTEMFQAVSIPGVITLPISYALAGTMVVLMVVLSGLFTILYSLLNRLIGPPALGPLDAPPVRRSPSKRR